MAKFTCSSKEECHRRRRRRGRRHPPPVPPSQIAIAAIALRKTLRQPFGLPGEPAPTARAALALHLGYGMSIPHSGSRSARQESQLQPLRAALALRLGYGTSIPHSGCRSARLERQLQPLRAALALHQEGHRHPLRVAIALRPGTASSGARRCPPTPLSPHVRASHRPNTSLKGFNQPPDMLGLKGVS